VPVAAGSITELLPLIGKAEDEGATLIEVRLDYLDSVDGIEKIVEYASRPLIATNRQYGQGGRRAQEEETRIQNLIRAAATGFQYADIELTTRDLGDIISRLRDMGVKPIVSFHELTRTPGLPEMRKVVKAEIESGAEVCKMVTAAKGIEDNVPCLLLLSEMCKLTKMVSFAMGEAGLISRVLSPVFGGYFTYASVGKGVETAPGQITISELKNLYGTLGVQV